MRPFSLDMTAEGADILSGIMRTAFKAAGCEGVTPKGDLRGITHYAIRPAVEGKRGDNGRWEYGREPKPTRVVFFNHYDLKPAGDDKVVCPFKMNAEGTADFARRWLEQVDYGPQYDTDGHCQKGWRLYNERYGHIDGDFNSVIAVAPAWIIYSK